MPPLYNFDGRFSFLEFMWFDVNWMFARSVVDNVHRSSISIQASSTSLQDCCTLHRCVHSGERSVVKVAGLCLAGIDLSAGVNKVLKGLDSVGALSRKLAVGGGVFHKERIDGTKASLVGRHGASPVCLVDIDLSRRAHVEEALLGVHVTLGRHPRGSVDSTPQSLVTQILPLDRQGDGVFCLNVARLGHPTGRGCRDPHRPCDSGQRPLGKVNVV